MGSSLSSSAFLFGASLSSSLSFFSSFFSALSLQLGDLLCADGDGLELVLL